MEIRPITDDEVPAFRAVVMSTFGGDAQNDPGGDERLRTLIQPGRLWGAFDGGRLVATAGSFALTMTVPGGTLPVAGLTMVTVRPTHRRRGILRRLIDLHLDDARQRGDGASGLWASEGSIYGRFGYGIAVEVEDLAFAASGLEIAPDQPSDSVDLIDDPAAALPPIYERTLRPGSYTRSEAWWRLRKLTDRPDLARGASTRRHAVARRDGVATGYVTYRQRQAWEHGLAIGSVEIEELCATDPRAEITLWRYLCSIDLFPRVTWGNAPLDALLPWVCSDPRRLRRRRNDTLWLRVEDLATALTARGYGCDDTLRLRIEDGPVHELAVQDGRARCTPIDHAADLTFARSALGSVYLGGVRPSLLARTGHVSGGAHAIARADRLFAAPLAPWCAEMF